MVTYTQRGGAAVNSVHATWPFGKIEVESGKVRLSVLGQSITLTPAEIISARVHSTGIVFDYRTSTLGQTVTFECFSQRRLLNALEEAGFRIQVGGDGFKSS